MRRPRASASANVAKTSIAGSDDWSSIAIGGIASSSAAIASRTTGSTSGSQTASGSGPLPWSSTAGEIAPARTTPAATRATAENQRTESLVEALDAPAIWVPGLMSAPESHFGAPIQSSRIDIGRIVSPPGVRTVTDERALIIIGGTAHGAMRIALNSTGDDIVVTPSQPQMCTASSCHEAINDAGDAGRLESKREPGRSPAVRPPSRATPGTLARGCDRVSGVAASTSTPRDMC